MKKIIKTLIAVTLLASFTLCKANHIHIDSISTYSQYYNNDSSNVYLTVNGTMYNGDCYLFSTEVSYNADTVTLKACYAASVMGIGCYRTDTFNLGAFPNIPLNIKAVFRSTHTVNACADSLIYESDTVYISYAVTGIKEIENSSFSLMPNPATTKLTCTLTAPTFNTTLQLFTIQGQAITAPQNITQPRTEIDVSTLPAGLYFAVIQNEKERAIKKFVKQ